MRSSRVTPCTTEPSTSRHATHDMCIPLILVDNGSTLNICTKDTLDTLGVPSDYVKPNPCDIRAFDNSVSHGQGEVFIPLVIEGRMFQVQFQVLEHTILLHNVVGKTVDSSGGCHPIHSSSKSQVHHQ